MAVAGVMARIVTTQYRYKRPPKKRKPVAIEVPEVVTVRDRKRVAKVKSDSVSNSTPTPKPANDDRKAAIVTAKTPTEIREERRGAEDAELTKDSPRFQRGKPQAIVTNVSRKAARTDDEAATARWRAWMAKKLSDDG